MAVQKRRRSGKESNTYYFKHKGSWVNTGFSDKRLAEQEESKLRKQFEEEAHGNFDTTYRKYAASKIEPNLQDYQSHLKKALGGSKQCDMIHYRIQILCKELKWKTIQDITSNSFIQWRSLNEKSPKTLNEYLSSIRGLLDWMVKSGRLERNPLKSIERLSTKNKQTFKRRALTMDECERLLNAAAHRKITYLLAIYTGLRRNELKQLKWTDIEFSEDGRCSIILRPETTKNGDGGIIPVHRMVAEELRLHRGTQKPKSDFVLYKILPIIDTHRRILKKAGIEYEVDGNRRADFHALRHTYDTMMGNVGIPDSKRMLLMRHSDPKLTTQVYTDRQVIQLDEDVQSLPWIGQKSESTEDEENEWTRKRTPCLQKTGENVRQLENSNVVFELLQVLERNGLIRAETIRDSLLKWYLERGSNPHSLARIGF